MAIQTKKKGLIIPILTLDTSTPSTLIDQRQSPNMQNVRIERKQIKKKEGYSTLGGTSTGDIQFISEIDREGELYLFRISTRKFDSLNTVSGVWTDRTNGNLGGTTKRPVSSTIAKISGKNIVVFTNSVDVIKKWAGGTNNIADLGGSPPKARYILEFNRFVLAAYVIEGASIFPERVQWADYDDPESWTESTASNAGSGDLGGGEAITGMFRLGNNVVVTKQDSIWVGYLTGDDRVFQFDAVERNIGFMVNNTIKVIPGGLAIGLSKHGLIQFNGARAQTIAPGIFEDLRDNLNADLLQKSFAVIMTQLNEYWLYIVITGQTYPTRLYRYNYATGQVYKDLVTNITAAGLYTKLPNKELIDNVTDVINTKTTVIDAAIVDVLYPTLVLGDKDSQTYKFDFDLKNENGVAINAFWDTSDITPFPGYYSHWTELFFEGLGDTVTIQYSTDEGVTYTTLETITLTASMAAYAVYIDVLSEKLRIRVSNAVVSETFTMRNLYYKQPIQREAIEK